MFSTFFNYKCESIYISPYRVFLMVSVKDHGTAVGQHPPEETDGLNSKIRHKAADVVWIVYTRCSVNILHLIMEYVPCYS